MFYGNSSYASGNTLYGDITIPNNQQTGWYDLEVKDQNTSQWIMLNNALRYKLFLDVLTQMLSTIILLQLLMMEVASILK